MPQTRAAGTLTDVRRSHGFRLVDCCGAPGDAHGVPGYDEGDDAPVCCGRRRLAAHEWRDES